MTRSDSFFGTDIPASVDEPPPNSDELPSNVEITTAYYANGRPSSDRVYDLGMPKFVYIQLRDVGSAIRMRGDKIERKEADKKYIITIGAETIGEFLSSEVKGWWIQDDTESK